MVLQQKILIVDDKNENLVALRQVLRELGAEIVSASSGNEALAATLDHSFALAILDVMMPGMNGFELAEHLRSDDSTRLLPIIFVTALHPDEQNLFSGYEAGAVDYIVKPYSPDILRAKVRVFLELDRQKQEIKWQRDNLDLLVAERTLELELELSARKKAEEEREMLKDQLHQTQKLESIGRLAGGVAHDFNNMLVVIIGHTELALLEMDEEHQFYNDIMEIKIAAERSAELTRHLLAFARKQTVKPIELDLNKTVESMLKMLKRLIGEDISLQWQPEKDSWLIHMDPSQIDQILANLCANARDAIGGVGKVMIATRHVTFDAERGADTQKYPAGDYVALEVSDSGCGMDQATLANIFEPFFTTKEMGKGTGLGLASVYGVVKQNNGFIDVRSQPGNGTTFTIYFPRRKSASTLVSPSDEQKPAARGSETILVVEDEPAILVITTMLLESLGYRVLGTTLAEEAIRLAEDHVEKIDLLMTDVIMPDMNGFELAKKMSALNPDIRQLFMSGYTSDIIESHGVLGPEVNFIQKPFSLNLLAEKVREALA